MTPHDSNMIQHLLRGQLLYVVLGVLIVFFYVYVRALPVKPVAPLESLDGPSTPHRADALDWWPQEIDTASLKQIAMQKPRLAIALSVLSVFTMGMGLAGVALALSGLRSGRIRSVWRYPSRQLPRWSFGELSRITVLTLMVVSLLPLLRFAMPLQQLGMSADSHRWIPVSMLLLDACVILTILAFAARKGTSVWNTFGFSTRQLAPSLTVGFRGYVAVFPWLFLLLFVTVEAMRRFGLKPPIEPIQVIIFQEHDPAVLGLTVLLACVVGPVAEELFFRGVLYTAVRQRTSRMVAMLTSGAAFSLIHTSPVGFLPILVIGCLLAHLYERTGSLLSPLAVHILHNTLLMSLALMFRELLSSGIS